MNEINSVDALTIAFRVISLENEVHAPQAQVPHSNDDHRFPSGAEPEAANDPIDGDVQTGQTETEKPAPLTSLIDMPGEVLR